MSIKDKRAMSGKSATDVGKNCPRMSGKSATETGTLPTDVAKLACLFGSAVANINGTVFRKTGSAVGRTGSF